ncbi:nitroreductase family protein [Tessaracoccus sp. OS52]|uniref:nitroreductase family protein n=1 Tax=Tessaracoccus sp. OS52 TaxID=2886691 RepID=UPI001D110634|nr:nitroreductase family protein [Tessaracoccus sp. OS52]
MTQTIDRSAITSAPISEVIANRWSPRSFDTGLDVPEEKVTALLEAARWAASAGNTQPWRFIVARRGSRAHARIVENLMGFNKVWAGSAALLVVNLAERVTVEGAEQRWAEYDLGQAVATLSLQAHKDGLHAHQMGGFEAEGLRQAFGIEERFEVVSVTAIGILAAPEALADEVLREREVAPRSRRPLEEIVLINE